jgi:hypothetical protein
VPYSLSFAKIGLAPFRVQEGSRSSHCRGTPTVTTAAVLETFADSTAEVLMRVAVEGDSVGTSSGAALVAMMQSANLRELDHRPFRRVLDPS